MADARERAIKKVLEVMGSQSEEEAREKGDVKSLLAFKLGTFDNMVNAEMEKIEKQEGNIKEWIKRYKAIDKEIALMEEEKKKAKEGLIAQKRKAADEKIKQVKALGIAYERQVIEKIERDFLDEKEKIEKELEPQIKNIDLKIKHRKLDKLVYERLIDDFYKQNKATIDKLLQEEKEREIRESGLLHLIKEGE